MYFYIIRGHSPTINQYALQVVSMDVDEPPTKRTATDYSLCVVCQQDIQHQKLTDTKHPNFNDTSYTNILTAVLTKAEYGNADYVSVNRRLYNVTDVDLKHNGASWHPMCYKTAIRNVQRDKERAERAHVQNDGHILKRRKGRPSTDTSTHKQTSESLKRTTRTSHNVENFEKSKCLFCQNNTDEELKQCQSRNKGKEIQKIIENSGNMSWQIKPFCTFRWRFTCK